VNKDICIVPLNPKLLDVRRAVAAARAADRTVFFCYETRLMPGCRRMLDALQRASKNLVVVLLRSPYDRASPSSPPSVTDSARSRPVSKRSSPPVPGPDDISGESDSHRRRPWRDLAEGPHRGNLPSERSMSRPAPGKTRGPAAGNLEGLASRSR
jgi:hypothetical protein